MTELRIEKTCVSQNPASKSRRDQPKSTHLGVVGYRPPKTRAKNDDNILFDQKIERHQFHEIGLICCNFLISIWYACAINMAAFNLNEDYWYFDIEDLDEQVRLQSKLELDWQFPIVGK